jgi:hypothetical protein
MPVHLFNSKILNQNKVFFIRSLAPGILLSQHKWTKGIHLKTKGLGCKDETLYFLSYSAAYQPSALTMSLKEVRCEVGRQHSHYRCFLILSYSEECSWMVNFGRTNIF